MSGDDELQRTLEQTLAERQSLSDQLDQRDAEGYARLAAQEERVEALEEEQAQLQQRLEHHQRELRRLAKGLEPAITMETLGRLGGVSFVLTCAAFGLSSNGATLAGMTAVGGLVAFMLGYLGEW